MKIVFITIYALSLLSACSSYSLPIVTNKAPLVIADSGKFMGSIEIYDSQALKVLAKTSKVSVRGEGYTWVEGPLWIDDGQYLLFSDIPKNIIRKYDPKEGNSIYLKNTGASVVNEKHRGAGSNGLEINHKKQLVLMQHGDRQVAVMNAKLNKPEASYSPWVSKYKGLQLNSPNDGVFDNKGNLYFTDPPYGLGGKNKRKSELGFNGIYRVTPEGEITLLDDSVTFPNGIDLSPDNKTLYVAVSDPKAPVWFAYDLSITGQVSNKRVFYRVEEITEKHSHGLPDGMAVHSSGLIFATGPEGVWLFNPQGKVLAKIKTGQLTSNCTLTTNEEYLFITADDYLLSVPLIH